MKRLALVGALVASAVAMMLGPAGDAGAVGKQVMVRLTAAPEIPSGAQRIGAVSPAATETGAVVLKPRNEGALTSFIASLTTAGSSSFHHYLAPGQFESRFGPAQATIHAVSAPRKPKAKVKRAARIAARTNIRSPGGGSHPIATRVRAATAIAIYRRLGACGIAKVATTHAAVTSAVSG